MRAKHDQIAGLPTETVRDCWGSDSIDRDRLTNGMVPTSLRSTDQGGIFVTSTLVEFGARRIVWRYARYGSEECATNHSCCCPSLHWFK